MIKSAARFPQNPIAVTQIFKKVFIKRLASHKEILSMDKKNINSKILIPLHQEVGKSVSMVDLHIMLKQNQLLLSVYCIFIDRSISFAPSRIQVNST